MGKHLQYPENFEPLSVLDCSRILNVPCSTVHNMLDMGVCSYFFQDEKRHIFPTSLHKLRTALAEERII